MRRAAMANIRPNCPLPSTPMAAPGSIVAVTLVRPNVLGQPVPHERRAVSRAKPDRDSPGLPPRAAPHSALRLSRSPKYPPEPRPAFERLITASPVPSAHGSPPARPAPAAAYWPPPFLEDAPPHPRRR